MNVFFDSQPRVRQQKSFVAFYDRYAPALWGIILLANLPLAQSKMILSATFLAAGQYSDRQALINKQGFAWLLSLAYAKGLPANVLTSVFRKY